MSVVLQIQETLPVEQVDDPLLVGGHVLEEVLHGGALHLHPRLLQVLGEGLLVHVSLDHRPLLPRDLLVILAGTGDHLGQLQLKIFVCDVMKNICCVPGAGDGRAR